ncbi:hypothetical protein ACFE04_011822 [Oxalis oulophora]
MSTLTIPQTIPSVADDCEQLRKAFSGWGTNENLIIDILAHRNAEQRKLIRQKYAETFNEDLLKELNKELTSDFERVVVLWTLYPSERDAFLANEATKRWTSSNQVLVEIACTRSSHELLLAKQGYHARFKKSLEEDVARHTTGDFRKLLVPLVSSYRYEGDEVNLIVAKADAKLLHQKISEKAYNNEDLILILATRSKAQINATLNHYKNEFGNDINKVIKQASYFIYLSSARCFFKEIDEQATVKDLKADPKDEYLRILRNTIKCLTRPEKYYEKMLRLAINKTGTDEGALTRVVATRAEVDMKLIKEEYQRRSSIPLDRAIAKDTSGDYERMLLALIGHVDG